MKKEITVKWLKKENACPIGIIWFKEQKNKSTDHIIKLLKKENKLDGLNWLITRLMKYKQYVSYAVYAAEQVIHLYEEKYPDDKRPRKAIEAAKKCIKSPTEENKSIAAASAASAYAAVASAAYAYAASASAYAASASAAAVYATAASVSAASVSAAYAASAFAAAAYASAAAKNKMKLKIINYGIKLLKECLKCEGTGRTDKG